MCSSDLVPGVILAIGARLLLSLRHEAVPGVNSITLAAGIALLTAIMLRTFWVRLSPPSGFEVRREETPRLFLLIDKLTNALNTTPLHQVFIVNELQAVVVPTPRIGLFGRHQHTLLLGLPLMLATTPVQFRALLVHEFSHLSRHHDRFSAWSYRTRLVWTRLLEELTARDHWSSLPLRKFLSWYVPYFNACSLALARAQIRALVPPGTVLCIPTAPCIAPRADAGPQELDAFRTRAMALTCIAGVSGLPQVSLPATVVEGCPVGLSFIGWPGGDEALLDLAVALSPYCGA